MYTPNKSIINNDKIKLFTEFRDILKDHSTPLGGKKGKLLAIRVSTRRGVGERRYNGEDITCSS